MRSLLMTFSLLLSLNAFAEYKSSDEIVKEFKTFTKADGTKGNEHLADLVAKVDDAVKYATVEKASSEALTQIVRVSAITLKHDDSAAVADVLIPLYKKDLKAFKKALKTLPKSDADSLLKSIQDAIKEEQNGNG
ncbi:hypothetical protein [Bdellovibrio sp. NC01]|uniref:hypothetical protein n=1 Tax=Bdellovibrio sp. NC01 TaxID=2220073 RepID=UPI00115A305E|nr:hypothetical protein [Bdellovibrio sp. NC01]QDK36992.1 hypothetical protein DOE51_04985 [Bdellovibrio sp. NC01]